MREKFCSADDNNDVGIKSLKFREPMDRSVVLSSTDFTFIWAGASCFWRYKSELRAALAAVFPVTQFQASRKPSISLCTWACSLAAASLHTFLHSNEPLWSCFVHHTAPRWVAGVFAVTDIAGSRRRRRRWQPASQGLCRGEACKAGLEISFALLFFLPAAAVAADTIVHCAFSMMLPRIFFGQVRILMDEPDASFAPIFYHYFLVAWS